MYSNRVFRYIDSIIDDNVCQAQFICYCPISNNMDVHKMFIEFVRNTFDKEIILTSIRRMQGDKITEKYECILYLDKGFFDSKEDYDERINKMYEL